jgi:hypothetical protein
VSSAPSPAQQPGSGLFPAGPPRPSYREPHPVRGLAVLAGLGGATCWLVLFALLGGDLRGQVWWTVAAGGVAWLAALALARYGDRGVAVGVTVATGVAWAVAGGAVAVHWGFTGDWPLW